MTPKKLIATVAAGVVAFAVALGGATIDVVASAPASSGHAAKKETRAEKLAKALKACKKETPKSKRKKRVAVTGRMPQTQRQCEALAKKKYQKKTVHPEEPTTTGTGTGTTTGTTTGTGTGTTTGTTTGTATGTTTGTTTGGTQKPTRAEVEKGKPLFNETCTTCHGMMGQGTALAPPYGPELPRSESQKGVVEQLTNPLNTKGCMCMPNYNSKYSTTEKEAIGAYVAVELTRKETAH
jgi:mono/diheme cytochrome c family protein